MPVIAIVNRKGGSGKSMLATHLAAYFATNGVPVMLGDTDRQQSTQTWLRLRQQQTLPASAPVVGWAVDPKRVLRPPAGLAHVVLDTPGGMRGFDLARVVGFADVILMPVANSIFDRESSAEGWAELLALPRVASGRCKVAAIGMRLDGRTRAAEVMARWADDLKLPFIGVLRETQAYVKCIERGLAVFDLPPERVREDLAQWRPIVAWVEAALRAVQRRAATLAGEKPASTTPGALVDADRIDLRAPAANDDRPASAIAGPTSVGASAPAAPGRAAAAAGVPALDGSGAPNVASLGARASSAANASALGDGPAGEANAAARGAGVPVGETMPAHLRPLAVGADAPPRTTPRLSRLFGWLSAHRPASRNP